MAKATIDIVGRDFTGAAFDKADSRLGKLQATALSLRASLVGLGTAIPTAAFASIIKQAADAQDALAKMSKATGLSVETLAGLEFAASQSGVSLDKVAQGVRRFSRLVLESQDGTDKYGRLIRALGLNLEELKTATPEEQFLRLAGAIEQNVAEQERAVVVTSLFGNEYAKLIPLLSTGEQGLRDLIEQGRELNPVTAESAAQAEKFNDNLDKLGRTASALGTTLFNNVAPALVTITEKLAESAQQGTLFQDTLSNILRSALGFGGFAAIGKLFEDTSVSIKDANAATEQLTENNEELSDSVEKPVKQYKSFQEELDRINRETEKSKTSFKDVATSVKDLADSTSVVVDEQRQQAELMREIDRVTRSVETADERLNRELQQLNALLQTGQLDWQVYQRAVQNVRNEFDSLDNEVGQVADELNQFSLQAARDMQVAFGQIFFDVFEGRVKNIEDIFVNAVKRMVAEAAAADLLNALFGTGRASNLQGVFNAFFGGGGGSRIGTSGIFASGAGLLGGLFGRSSGGGLISAGGAFENLPGLLPTAASGVASTSRGLSSIAGTALAAVAVTLTVDSILKSIVGDLSTGSKALDSIPIIGTIGAGLFGRGPLKIRDSLIRGSVTEEGIGQDFLTASNFKAKGGLLRGDKVDRVIINANTGELVTGAPGLPESGISSKLLPFADEASKQAIQIGQLFNDSIRQFNAGLRQSADVLGLSTTSLDNFNTFIQLTSDSAEAITDSDIAAAIQNIGDQMANTLLPGIENFARGNETAIDALRRITGEFQSLQNALRVLGISNQQATAAVKALGIETRTALVDLAGGLEEFNAKIAFFADNFLTAEERLEINAETLNAELTRLGLSTDITVEQFKKLILSVTQAGGVTVEFANELLSLAPSFLAVRNEEARLASESLNAASAVGTLSGAVGSLGPTITASFQRIDDARAAVRNAEGELAIAQARQTLSDAQAELQLANADLSNAQSLLAQAQSAEQSRINQEINDVISQRNELIASYQDEANALRGIVTRFEALADRILDFNDSLALSSLSPFKPGEQLAIAQQQFNQTRAAAAAGDEKALEKLPEVARAFLEASEKFNAPGSAAFASDFNFVQQVLESAGVTAQAISDSAADQLAGIEATISELQLLNEQTRDIVVGIGGINESVISVDEALARVQEANERVAAAQEEVNAAQSSVNDAVRANGGFINDVEKATNAVEVAVRELSEAVLQGFGNAFISDQQIRDFVIANQQLTDAQFAQIAVAFGVSGNQLKRALAPLGISAERVNAATGGAALSDADIAAFVDQKLAEGDFMAIYNAAIANGISSERLARASVLTKEEIDNFVRANNLRPFRTGTDFVRRDGIALLHKGEAVVPSSAVDAMKQMREELAELRREQNRQMSALINTMVRTSEDNARAISVANERIAANSAWINRVAAGAR